MTYKRNNKRFSVKGRGTYLTKADFIMTYYADLEACKCFFFDMKWPTGYYCEKCGCTHHYYMKGKGSYRCCECHHDERLLSNTCFQDCKLPLNKLLYGIFLIYADKRSISSLELTEELNVNYKTACLLQTKCRLLMRSSNTKQMLDSSFYESDVVYIGAKSEGKQGMGTDKQAFLVILSTHKEHEYPMYVKLIEIEKDSGANIEAQFSKNVKMSKDRILNTDGKTTFNILKSNLQVKNDKINYQENESKLYFLNKIASNFKSTIQGIYHGIGKRMIPLYFSEFEWRFNHRHTKDFMGKICKYIRNSTIMTRKDIVTARIYILSIEVWNFLRDVKWALTLNNKRL